MTNSREKRGSSEPKYIELSVFVDEKMYKNVEGKKKAGEDTLNKIQTLVYGYLNAVQIIYDSDRLTDRWGKTRQLDRYKDYIRQIK